MDNQLKADLDIRPGELDTEIMRQPGLYAYYAEQHQQASKAAKLAKLKAEVYEAGLYATVRDKSVARGVKPTENEIRSKILMDETWRRHQETVIDAEAQEEQMKSIVRAIDQKKEMLITYAANRRQEAGSSFAMKQPKHEPVPDHNGQILLFPSPST